MADTTYSLPDLHKLIADILVGHNTSADNAEVVARALVAAEADSQKGHGASRVPSYAAQSQSGKVAGHVRPELIRLTDAACIVDACDGFAYPALEMARSALIESLAVHPIAAVSIRNTHHSGVVAHHVEPLAEAGFIGISMGNGPQAIAPWGGNRGLFGTNPIGFAAPRIGQPALVIDMSLSKVARGRINVAAAAGEPIPEGWAFDAEGMPTTDAKAAMAGTMAPMGDAKGTQLVLMVEILAGALSASCFGYESSSYFAAEGAPPRAGQVLIGINPGPFSEGRFDARLSDLLEAIESQPGARLPGQKRLQARASAADNGVTLPAALNDELLGMHAKT